MAYTSQQQYYANLTRSIAAQYGIDPNIAEVQIFTESRFNPNASSPAGAKGIAQFMPATAQRFGLTNPFDPTASLHAYGKYMRYLLDLFGGNYSLALAGYNAGEGRVKQYGNKVPPIAETQNYVAKIIPYLGTSPASTGLASQVSQIATDLSNDGLNLSTEAMIGIFIFGLGAVLFLSSMSD